MKRFCTYCGAVLEPNAKICTNCGKVVSSKNQQAVRQNTRSNAPQQFSQQGFDSRQRTANRYNPMQNQPAPQRVYEHPKRVAQRQPQYAQPPVSQNKKKKRPTDTQLNMNAFTESGRFEENQTSGKENRSKLKPIIFRIIKIAVVLLVLYFGFAFVRIFMVSHAGYEFETKMTLSSDNYGDAMSNYFDDGSWKFTLFKNQVSYEGKKGSEEYVLTFKRQNGQTVCDSITIDGKKVTTDKLMDTYVMGMFMAEKVS